MLDLQIPGGKRLRIKHLLLDFNGTLAFDGKLIAGITEDLRELAGLLTIHVITADTFGDVRQQLDGSPVELTILGRSDQAHGKLDYLSTLGFANTVAIGNGRNDGLMLKQAALGIALIQQEGACVDTLLAADVTCTSIGHALGLLLHPKRLTATLRT